MSCSAVVPIVLDSAAFPALRSRSLLVSCPVRASAFVTHHSMRPQSAQKARTVLASSSRICSALSAVSRARLYVESSTDHPPCLQMLPAPRGADLWRRAYHRRRVLAMLSHV